MATQSNFLICDNGEMREATDNEQTEIIEAQKVATEQQLAAEEKLNSERSLKISAYEKLGLTSDEIAALVGLSNK